MKQLFFITLSLFMLTAHAQFKNIQEARDNFWGAKDKYKNANTIPEKWNGESAVILYKNIDYAYHNKGKKIYLEYSIRQRVKILDKNALKEFSEFSYSDTSKRRIGGKKHTKLVGIKIIKPDGKEVVIDVDKEAVTKDSEIKVAVPNLEIGDIIDYFFYNFLPIYSYDAIHYFDPVEVTLSEEYPIMNLDFFLETEDDFFINFVSINGAPKLQKMTPTHKKYRNYKFSAQDIEKSDFPIWFYPMQELPGIKMQVYFIKKLSDVKRANVFISSEESIIKDHVTKDEIIKLYNKRLVTPMNITDIKNFLKKQHYKTQEEKIRGVYNFLRYKHVMKLGVYVVNRELDLFTNEIYKMQYLYYYDKVDFVREISRFLDEIKVPYEVLVGIYKYDGKLSNLIIEDNVRFVIRTKTEKPLYISFFNDLSTVSYVNPYLEGTDVYVLSAEGSGGKKLSQRKLTKIKDGKIPVSNYKDNVAYKKIELNLNENLDGFKVKTYSKMTGHAKYSEQSDKLLFVDYLYDDMKKYRNDPFTRKMKIFSKTSRYKKKIESVFDKFKKQRKEELEDNIQSEFNLDEEVKDYDYKFIKLGRDLPDEAFEFEESFTFKNQYIKKAGRNYIIEIGKFIGGQITIDEKDKDRKENIYMRYPRVFNYDIVLNIPEGYTVKGLDKLNKKVENETGAFISTAKLEGNKLIVSTSKQYKNNYFPREKWKDILAFLEEAIQFTNEKVLLKKQ